MVFLLEPEIQVASELLLQDVPSTLAEQTPAWHQLDWLKNSVEDEEEDMVAEKRDL